MGFTFPVVNGRVSDLIICEPAPKEYSGPKCHDPVQGVIIWSVNAWKTAPQAVSSIAQWIGRITHNRKILGSSPCLAGISLRV